MTTQKALAGVIFGGLVAATSYLGTRATQQSVDNWYPRLAKPPFQPPRWVFPVVWTSLYAAMAVAGWRIWNAPKSKDRTAALAAWGAQLGFNGAWSPLFFAKRRPDLALADQGLLYGSLLAFLAKSRRVDRTAHRLFLPYLGWVTFAAVLNEEVVRRNPRFRSTLSALQ